MNIDTAFSTPLQRAMANNPTIHLPWDMGIVSTAAAIIDANSTTEQYKAACGFKSKTSQVSYNFTHTTCPDCVAAFNAQDTFWSEVYRKIAKYCVRKQAMLAVLPEHIVNNVMPYYVQACREIGS